LNHTEFISKLEELSHVIQGTSVTIWDLFLAQVTVYMTMVFTSLLVGVIVMIPLMKMNSIVMEEIKDSGTDSNAPLWFVSMLLALIFSITIGGMSWCIGQEFVSGSVSHERELKEQHDLYQQSSTDLYNQLVDMSDEDFEKLSTANSKFELTKEQREKYMYVTKAINKVTKNKNK
jgi:hypothetical protein